MKRIRVLPEGVKNKIAAGEVIEGPFSVVKELMENSLDAGATRIEAQVQDAGLRRILVRDNGAGIAAEDLPLSVVEHATSKIREIGDIERIGTYGFRGEALSSIAAVSELTILSRSGDEETGSRLVTREGEVSVQAFAGPPGTTVIAENLFYNIPARKKFLKSRSAEMRHLREAFLRTALPHIGVEFILETDGRRAITIAPASSLDERIASVYRIDAGSLFHEQIRDIKVAVSGYCSTPRFMKTSRSLQQLYVNGRPVEHRYLGSLLSRAYEGAALKGEYPAAFIFMDIDPALVDVNIHPAKREVKFFDQRYLDGLVFSLVRKGLSGPQRSGAETVFRDPVPADSGGSGRLPAVSGLSGGDGIRSFPGGLVRSVLKESMDLYAGTAGHRPFVVLGVAFGTYCIVEMDGVLHFVDIHAAHERVIFDALIAGKGEAAAQELLFPKVLQLSAPDHGVVMDNLGELESMGFRIEDFSDNSVLIRALPQLAGAADPEKIIGDFIEAVKEDRSPEPAGRKIAASVACHSAKRAGDDFTAWELSALVEKALEEGREMRCPHGRPYLYTINKNDLERIFKRQ